MKKYIINKEYRKKIKGKVLVEEDLNKKIPLPKYSAQIMNVISGTGQSTRPKYVGQMSELIPEFINEFYEENDKFPDAEEWKKHYLENHSEKYNAGLERLKEYVSKYKEALEFILNSDDVANDWYDRFIFYQNFSGFQYEEILFEFVKREFGFDKNEYIFRKSTPEEESKNIDFVCEKVDSEEKLLFNSKPSSYSIENKNIKIDPNIIIVRYEKIGDDISISIDDADLKKIEDF